MQNNPTMHGDSTIATKTDLSNAQFMQRVYMWMCSGLVVTTLAALFVSVSPDLVNIIFGNPVVFYGLLIAELVVVFSFLSVVSRVKSSTAVFLFLLYSLLNGVTFSSVFIIFTDTSIVMTFAITAGMFGITSIYGYVTKKDLTTVGNIAIMGLIGIILASLLNLFFQDTVTEYVISYVGVVVFTALTAYDTQKIKKYNTVAGQNADGDRKESIVGALNLYLDFVNLFLMLLRIFGRRR